jgi:hypothetical protein
MNLVAEYLNTKCESTYKQCKNGDVYRREVFDFLERLEFLERVDFWLPLGEEGLQRKKKLQLR